MPFKDYKVPIEIFFFWVFPIVVVTLSLLYLIRIYGLNLAAFLVLAPVLTMYWVVGTGAGYCKFWYFTTRYSPRGVMLTIGLLYTSVVHLPIIWTQPMLEFSPALFILTTAAVVSLGGTVIDVFLLGAGLFYLKSKKHPLGSDPIRHALSYGPVFFGLVGAWNAALLVCGKTLMETCRWSVAITLGILPVAFALPFILFFLRRHNQLVNDRGKNRTLVGAAGKG